MRATVQDRQDRVDRVEAAPVWDPRWDLPQVEAPVAAHPPRGVVWNEVLRDVRVRRIAAALFAAWMVGAGILLLVMRPAPSGERVARPATAIDPTLVRVGTATLPLVDVYDSPAQGSVTKTLEHPTATGGALVFLIEAEWQGWYRVQVPTPPAGTSGWIQASAVDVAEHHIHVTIDLGDHLLEVTDAGEPVLHAPIAVGAHDTPRPGITFVTESIEMANPRTGYGTHALTLAGYPNGDETFFRGQGLVAIHGLDDPLALGQTVEDGSIGLSNADVKKLFQLVPPGTPVEILGEG